MPNGKVNRGLAPRMTSSSRGYGLHVWLFGISSTWSIVEVPTVGGLVSQSTTMSPSPPPPKERATAAVHALVRKAVKSNSQNGDPLVRAGDSSSSLKLGLLEFERKDPGVPL